MNFYIGIFKQSRVLAVQRFGKMGPGPEGAVMLTSFELNGVKFTALNGGPGFKDSKGAASYVIDCANQEEVDHYWDALSAGGGTYQCGWLHDKFGVTWQVVPIVLPKLLGGSDPVKVQRVMAAMMPMKKLIIADLERA